MGFFGSKYFSLKYWGKFFIGLSGGLPAPTVSDIVFMAGEKRLTLRARPKNLIFTGEEN